MDREFPNSANLALLLKMYGWALYDIATSLNSPFSPSLDEIAFDESTSYELHHRYYLLPIAKEGETLKKSYAALREKKIYPVLAIPTTLSKEEKSFNIRADGGFTSSNFKCYYLNEFYFQEDALCTSNSFLFAPELTSRVTIPAPHALNAFSRYFDHFQFTDKGAVLKKLKRNYIDIN